MQILSIVFTNEHEFTHEFIVAHMWTRHDGILGMDVLIKMGANRYIDIDRFTFKLRMQESTVKQTGHKGMEPDQLYP